MRLDPALNPRVAFHKLWRFLVQELEKLAVFVDPLVDPLPTFAITQYVPLVLWSTDLVAGTACTEC